MPRIKASDVERTRRVGKKGISACQFQVFTLWWFWVFCPKVAPLVRQMCERVASRVGPQGQLGNSVMSGKGWGEPSWQTLGPEGTTSTQLDQRPANRLWIVIRVSLPSPPVSLPLSLSLFLSSPPNVFCHPCKVQHLIANWFLLSLFRSAPIWQHVTWLNRGGFPRGRMESWSLSFLDGSKRSALGTLSFGLLQISSIINTRTLIWFWL